MDDQYGLPDLRHYLAAGNFFAPPPPPPSSADFLGNHPSPYNLFAAAAGSNGGGARTGSADLIEFKIDVSGGDGSATVRWPRQETLALLEIRSRLDSRFKEANQKGPLWEEVSRIMFEEHGYQRTGKKCREKFENLYKYYKKTKEGKAGRQDGKHYRFFRQLEALYGGAGEPSNFASASLDQYNFPGKIDSHEPYNFDPKLSETTSIISLSNSFNSDTTSSDYHNNDPNLKKRKSKKSLKSKIRHYIDVQMKEIVEKQEAWMEKMMQTMESKEQERLAREEQWRKQDASRIEREHRLWTRERNWIKTRDAALMEAVQKLTGNQVIAAATSGDFQTNVWQECNDVSRLVQPKFDQGMEHTISLNDNANPDGLFRYFLGDGHGRLI